MPSPMKRMTFFARSAAAAGPANSIAARTAAPEAHQRRGRTFPIISAKPIASMKVRAPSEAATRGHSLIAFVTAR